MSSRHRKPRAVVERVKVCQTARRDSRGATRDDTGARGIAGRHRTRPAGHGVRAAAALTSQRSPVAHIPGRSQAGLPGASDERAEQATTSAAASAESHPAMCPSPPAAGAAHRATPSTSSGETHRWLDHGGRTGAGTRHRGCGLRVRSFAPPAKLVSAGLSAWAVSSAARGSRTPAGGRARRAQPDTQRRR